jgi:transcriptional regulator with XRE-family HTH domain
MTQADFAASVGLSAATISQNESNASPVSRMAMEKLHQKHGVSADWLLFGEGEMFLPSNEPCGEKDELSDAPSKLLNSSSLTETRNEDAAPKLAHEIKAKFDTAYEHDSCAPSGAFFLFTGAFCAIWLLLFRLIGVL